MNLKVSITGDTRTPFKLTTSYGVLPLTSEDAHELCDILPRLIKLWEGDAA